MKWLFKMLSRLFGRNLALTPKDAIIDQMNEPRPLPMGRTEFMVWSDRIISGCLVPSDPNQSHETHIDSIRYALANMLLHLGPTESHKPDAYFIHSLRKYAVNQVADALRKELFEKGKKRAQAREAEDSMSSIDEDDKDAKVLEFHS